MADLVIQRVVFPLDQNVASLYYRVLDRSDATGAPNPAPVDRRSIVLGRDARIDTNTYFNGFFEAYWRRYSTLGKLVLRLRLSGAGTVHLLRASATSGIGEVGNVDFGGEDQTLEIEAPAPRSDGGEPGMLYFEIVARQESVTLITAEWVAKDVEAKPVRLVAGYCTFDREEFVLNNIRALAEEPDLASCLARIVVVDQGTRRVTDHAGFRALPRTVVEKAAFFQQANFGGAGGFARCILEARRLPDATHILLLDDDAVIEPESVFRAAAFFSLAKQEFAVGGAMLDLLRPTRMYEAGGYVVPWRMGVGGRGRDLALDSPENVRSLARVEVTHYNAWWFFACPLATVDRLGLPLPVFIRCDDLEFGCRLMRAGVPTIALPGLGVWHQPFYLKKRGWLDYYSRRNILVALALHFPRSRLSLAAAFFGILVYRLLMLDYFKAWAVCEGMDDYLLGPSVLKLNPAGIHKRILEAHRRLSPEVMPKTKSLPILAAPPAPRSGIRQACSVLAALLRQFFRASPAANALPEHALVGADEHWFALRNADVVAIDELGSDNYAVLRRDRRRFLALLARGLGCAMRLLCAHGRVMRQWRAESKRLVQPEFWREYLGI